MVAHGQRESVARKRTPGAGPLPDPEMADPEMADPEEVGSPEAVTDAVTRPEHVSPPADPGDDGRSGKTERAGEPDEDEPDEDEVSASRGTAGPGAPASATGVPERGRRTADVRQWSWRLNLTGCWVMTVFASLSFTPSLLPRPGLYQGLVTGITAASGYALGVFLAWVWRQFADRPPRIPSKVAWVVYIVVSLAVLVSASIIGQRWQEELREVMGVEAIGGVGVFVPPSAVVVAVVLIGIGRLLARLQWWIASILRRRIGAAAARFTGTALVLGLLWALVSGLLVDVGRDIADEVFAAQDRTIDEGAVPPEIAERSGSPDSEVSWEALGLQGRRFVTGGPTPEQITAFTGEEAEQPIRVYAGLNSATDSEARAALAVAELERAGAFDRSHLLVATSTGRGWIAPTSVAAFEYLTGGDSAVVSMQYSYLPSWLSYLVDQDRAREAGRDLFDAVYGAWMQLPPDDRPELYVFGESLGSYGGESAFSGANDIVNRTSGALWSGPPNFNEMYRTFTDGRDAGSIEIEPVYREGKTVRFTADASEPIEPVDRPWDGTRVIYLLHPSDPVVWWDTDLLWQQPDWLGERRGHDVLDSMTWIPIVTFWQITFDLPVAGDVEPGHGHIYAGQHVDAWVKLLHLEDDWDAARSEELRELVLEFSGD